MRVAAAALILALAAPASAQDRVSAVTVASGYATGFEAGAVHSEIRLRVPVSARVAIEPVASWTQGFAYGQDILLAPCQGETPCYYGDDLGRSSGARALALGSALVYRADAARLPLGLDGAHAGVFAQAVYPIWSGRGQRVGAEVGAAARVGRAVRVGADVQAAYFTAVDGGRERLSITPLLRLSVGE